jgi:oxalate decarboxylase/phosphoglucose isomerase-like protein (cupin superfamily)
MRPGDHVVQRSGENRTTWHDSHGGSGAIDVQRYFERSLPWPIELELWVVPVGASEGTHVHDHSDADGYALAREVYLVVEGHARVTLDGVEHDFGPGDAFAAGSNVARGITNVGTTPLKVVIVNDPGPPLD